MDWNFWSCVSKQNLSSFKSFVLGILSQQWKANKPRIGGELGKVENNQK
jgi:hypothetical protein